MPLTAHRRHLDTCEHRDKGWNYTLCKCPIHCDGTLDGKRLRRSLNTNNWERALRRIGRLERGEDQDFLDTPAGNRTVAVAAAAYLADAKARSLAESTLKSVGRTLRQFVASIPDLSLDAVGVEHVSRFRSRKVTTARTQRKEIEHLRGFFAFCVTREWVGKNPAKLVKPPIVKDSPVLPYSADEVQRLLLACDEVGTKGHPDTPAVRKRARALVLTLLYSGLRISDVTLLKRSALERSNHLLLRITKNGVPLKLKLADEPAEALRKLPAPNGNPIYFFWTGNGDWGNQAKTLWRTVNSVGKKAGVHAHPHRFRHTFAVELLTKGADIRKVQQLLGHESINTTEKHYAHFVAAHQTALDEAAALLDFSSSTPGPLLVSTLKKRGRNA